MLSSEWLLMSYPQKSGQEGLLNGRNISTDGQVSEWGL